MAWFRLLIISVAVLTVKSQTQQFMCDGCSGYSCFLAPGKAPCTGHCVIEWESGFQRYFKRCGMGYRTGYYYQCKGDYCNRALPPIPPHVCMHCEADRGDCKTLKVCGSPNVWIKSNCYTIFDYKSMSMRKGCIGDLPENALRNVPFQEFLLELCDFNECNRSPVFLKMDTFRHPHMKCMHCEYNTCHVRICPNPGTELYYLCYYSFVSLKKGCLSDWSIEAYYSRIKHIQVCFGFMCNENLHSLTTTNCGNNICLRRYDTCTFTLLNVLKGCTTIPKSMQNFCAHYHACRLCSGYLCTEQLSEANRRCYVCQGQACNVIRLSTVSYMSYCGLPKSPCFSDPVARKRGCGYGPITCGSALCNDVPFGIYCYKCDIHDPNCAGHNFMAFQLEYCHGVHTCYTRTSSAGAIERGCGTGDSYYEDEIVLCSEQLCNKEPLVVPSCHRYSYLMNLSPKNNSFARLFYQNTDWIISSCNRSAGTPLCFMLFDSHNTIAGGCSSEHGNLLEMFRFKSYFTKLSIHFCDTSNCNKLDAQP